MTLQSETPPSLSPSRVHIMMATFEGERYLQAQLDSIAQQTHADWTLSISDDGSTDTTVGICEAFARNHPDRVRIFQGPRKGATANFFHLIACVSDDRGSDCYAFSDQDDVWFPHKLSSALTSLGQLHQSLGQPLLYCGRTQVVTEDLEPIGLSPMPPKPLGFGNALVQNVVHGNTMVFNASLLQLLRQVKPANAVLHDWTAYLAVTGCDGKIQFDPEPCLAYRQHAGNVVGSAHGWRDKLSRIAMIFQGQYRQWGDQTEAILDDLAPHLSAPALAQAQKFRSMRNAASPWSRIKAGWQSGIWRQTRSGELSLFIALACKKL